MTVVTSDGWFCRQNKTYTKKQKQFLCLKQNTASVVNKWHYNKIRKTDLYIIFILLYLYLSSIKRSNRRNISKINVRSLSWVVPIPMINEQFSIHTSAWDLRGNIGLEPVQRYDHAATISTGHCLESLVITMTVDHPMADILDEVDLMIITLGRILSSV